MVFQMVDPTMVPHPPTTLRMTVMLVLIEGHSDRGAVALVQIVAQGWVRHRG